MLKITFMGAGSSVFVKNVIGDCMRTEALRDSEFALYDIDGQRLNDSKMLIDSLNKNINDNRAKVTTYLGVKNRKDALRGADFVINAIQVGLYEPCTVIDFEVPKKYGIRQTIADTLGIGGIMRALRTIPVMQDFADDIEAVCPDALFLNYTNPMSMLAGYMQRYTDVRLVGLCHSVQVCSGGLLDKLGMQDKIEGRVDLIAGINHMAWLLEIKDKFGNDLYPEIREKAAIKNATEKHNDMVRFEYIKHLGYYCTESSEHNAEYNPWFIKPAYPELIERFNIPLDEYPRRCIKQINKWAVQREELLHNTKTTHTRSNEYASYIMDAVVTNKPFKIGGNVLNKGLITNLPEDACVEVPCMVDGNGINPCHVGKLPVQLAAMNMTNINVHLMTIEAAVTRKREDIYRAAMLEPRCAAILSIDDIIKMVDELIETHQAAGFMKEYK
ncbi:MAG TPA: alpha-glucosidase/alpha-galactosidase [Clostridia bacterium]|jgi:alpha-galactosidase|nr:alpha-glucosidase/alpha-galactosidase [Clostridiaceae bacterium]HOF27320.1 alpha-glucosidase/alpha-galactosidase [Clostridia bacterium]HOM35066.1 alpha-glucosidase/alpha-galactosidase [Clostridia bacterium]HOR90486.1 alpha-glucosidase/alpha-galactosidase [Clostridia bacterium]HOT71356.1 alpha-glucosidase/alpha-galactosidase [Clostridia bacterium]